MIASTFNIQLVISTKQQTIQLQHLAVKVIKVNFKRKLIMFGYLGDTNTNHLCPDMFLQQSVHILFGRLPLLMLQVNFFHIWQQMI